METILGLEITDEKDTVTDMQVLAREKWQERRVKYKQFLKKADSGESPETSSTEDELVANDSPTINAEDEHI